jgi:hypothetical protein
MTNNISAELKTAIEASKEAANYALKFYGMKLDTQQ